MFQLIKPIIFVFISFQLSILSINTYSEELVDLLEQVNDYDIDKQAAFNVIESGGGVYYHEMEAIVPLYPEIIHQEWLEYRSIIAKEIGTVSPLFSKEHMTWQNSAQSSDELLRDAKKVSLFFLDFCEKIATDTDSNTYFGPDNDYLLKSKSSLLRKIKKDVKRLGTESKAISIMPDSIRGSIITDSPLNIARIVAEIKEAANEINGKVFFHNYWEEEKQSGYVGVHAKILFPIKGINSDEETRYIIAELQIHLDCIMDGTPESVKERTHVLYESLRSENHDPVFMSNASKLLFLTALKKYVSNEHQISINE
ncbi:MAG: hypothetical protein H0W88_12785 [Parachlamydiaceae bacterium]|nr:hypothetical protein [Parachlamydiaceae bacterium]